jgi:uncharacterized repeat protein (TIGR03803 family)
MKRILVFASLVFFCHSAHAQSQLWGMTSAGSSNGAGLIFKTDSAGQNEQVQQTFFVKNEGLDAYYSDLVQAVDGKLYGLMEQGGANNLGLLFQFDPATSLYSKMLDFDGTGKGANPYGSLMLASDHKLYGMTRYGGVSGMGVVFQFDPSTAVYTKIFDFNGTTSGSYPYGALVQANDGLLYGMTQQGGANSSGVLFHIDPVALTFSNLLDFDPAISGKSPYGSLVLASDGMLYGMTQEGGSLGFGVLFQFNPATLAFAKQFDFDGAAKGQSPYGSLMQATDGKLYGMTYSGGANNMGVLFSYDPLNSVYSKQLDFDGLGNGSYPYGSLIQASNGMLYATTYFGGSKSMGTLFRFDPLHSVYSKLVDFNAATIGSYPYGSLMQATDGKLYGMTQDGGKKGKGLLFQFDPIFLRIADKIDFDVADKGQIPYGSLVLANDGKLYGMTQQGGIHHLGVLFQYDPASSTYTDRFDFDGTNSGSSPNGTLVQASDGMLYGMTQDGGANGMGVLFQFDPATNTYTKEFDFAGSSNGQSPYGSLIQATNGSLYGMTLYGGTVGDGVMFQFDPLSASFSKLIDYDGAAKGSFPYGSLLQASDGMLYGMTQLGGNFSMGVLFQYDPLALTYTKKINFAGAANGQSPNGTLMQATDGKLYGTTLQGGTTDQGVLFQYDPLSSSLVNQFNFDGSSNGQFPCGTLMQAADGNVYGMTQSGGTSNSGVLFQFNPTSSVMSKQLDFDGTGGATPYFTGLVEIALTINSSSVATSMCVGSPVSIPCPVTGSFDPGNVFTAQLSDATGSFASPVTIGSIVSRNPGTIAAVIPALSTPGTGYRIRVVSTAPAMTGMNNGSDITLHALPAVTASASATLVCAGATVTLTGGGAASFVWSPVVTDGVGFAISSPDTYTVTGTDANNCSNTATVSIAVNALPAVTANASATTVCAGSTITLTGGGALSFVWSPVVTDGVGFVISAPNTYTVTGTDANNCSNTATTSIVVNALPAVTANASATTVCTGTTVTLTGGGAVSYTWSSAVADGVGFVISSPDTYTVTGTDANNCSNTATTSIVVNALPAVTANASATTVCTGTTVTLTGGGAVSFVWSPVVTDGVGFVISSPDTYTVTGTDANNCSNTASTSIAVNDLPAVTANASTTAACTGSSIRLTGGGADSFVWSDAVTNGVAFTISAPNTYTVTGTDANNCSNTATISIAVNALPAVTANASATTVCAGTTLTLTGGGAASYAWSPVVTDGVGFVISSPNTYTVTGTDANHCSNTATVSIAVNPLPAVTANASATTVCAGSTLTLTGGGASSYVWSPVVTDGVGFVISSPNTFTVTGTDANQCSNTASVSVGVNPMPVSSTTASGSSLTADQGGATYQWLNCNLAMQPITGATAQNYMATANGNYAVIISDNNCTDTSACVNVLILGIDATVNNKSLLQVYPNPNNGSFTIKTTAEGVYFLLNELGQTVQTLRLNSSNEYAVTIETMNSGLYFLVGYLNGDLVRQKIVVSR